MKSKDDFGKKRKDLTFNLAFAVLTILIVVFFYKNILLATALLSIVSLIGLLKWKSKMTLMIFAIGAILGPIAEIISIHYGVWSYTSVNFFNIPLWLIPVWGNAAVFVYHISLEIKNRGRN